MESNIEEKGRLARGLSFLRRYFEALACMLGIMFLWPLLALYWGWYLRGRPGSWRCLGYSAAGISFYALMFRMDLGSQSRYMGQGVACFFGQGLPRGIVTGSIVVVIWPVLVLSLGNCAWVGFMNYMFDCRAKKLERELKESMEGLLIDRPKSN